MKTFNIILFFIILFAQCGCSLFKSQEKKIDHAKIWHDLWLAACPTSTGKGQIFIPKRTYAFTYDSIFNEEEAFWALALEVPLRGEETLVVPYSAKQTFHGSLFASLDKKTLQELGPANLLAWKNSWLALLNFLKDRQSWSNQQWPLSSCSKDKDFKCVGIEKNIQWTFSEEEIELKVKAQKNKAQFTWKFKRLDDNPVFTQQIVTLRHQKISQSISLHLYPSSCGK